MMGVLDSFSLKGKTALITGGAGTYGRQIVSSLAEAGAKVFMASRNVAKLEKVAEEYRSEGYDVSAFELEQGEESSILALKEEILGRTDRLDVLVNNAVTRLMKSHEDDFAVFEKSMRNNVTGVFLMTRAFGEIMIKQGSGSIINIGSIMGLIGPDASLYFDDNGDRYPGLQFDALMSPDYFVHKGGMVQYTKFSAAYYGRWGIRCNCVHPGGYGISSPGDLGFKGAKLPDDFYKRYSARTFLGRMANDTDLKGIITFLASDASLYVTGTNIPVDGGYTAK